MIVKRLTTGCLMFIFPFGDKTLRVRIGKYSNRIFIPYVEYGPFRSFLISFRFCQIEWSLTRWA